MPPPRILHLIDSAGIYGAERVILNLSSQLLARGDATPVVGCLVRHAQAANALYDAATGAGIEAMRLPVSNAFFWLQLPRMAFMLRRARIDLVHAHGYKPAVFAFVIWLMAGIPVTSTCHLWFKPEQGPLKKRLLVALEKWLYRRFSKVLAVSEDIRRTLVASGVPAARVELIANGVDAHPEPLPAVERALLRHSLGIGDTDFCVLNAARLTRQKAQSLLIDAAVSLKEAGQPCKFLVVGDGELKAELRARIAELGVADCVQLLGFRDDVSRLMAACDVFALPSLDEGMPMSLLEAVSARVPIIATPVGDIPKLVTDHQSGLLVPPQHLKEFVSALAWMRSHPDAAAAFAERAHRQLVASYSCEAMAEKYCIVYKDLLRGRH